MKFLKKFVSTLMATALIVLNAPSPITAYAATLYGTVCNSSSCAHGLTSRHYYSDEYGYVGTSRSFTTYQLNVRSLCSDYVVESVSVSGATNTTAAIEGKLVTVKLKINNYNEATAIYYTDKSGTTLYYRLPKSGVIMFIMPARNVTLTVGKSSVTVPTGVSIKTATSRYDETTIYSDKFDTNWHVRINGVECPRLVPSFKNSYLSASLSGLRKGDVYTIYSDPIHFYSDGYIVINTYDYDDMDTIYCAYDSNGVCYPGRYSGRMDVIRIPRKGDYTIAFERVCGDAPNDMTVSNTNNCKIFVIGTTDTVSLDSSEISYITNNTVGLANLYKLGTPVTFKLNLHKNEKIRFDFISCGMYWSSSYKPIIKIYSGQQHSLLTTINLNNLSQSTGYYEYTANDAGEYIFSMESSMSGMGSAPDSNFYVCRIVPGVSVAATLSSTSVEYGASAPILNVTGHYSSLSYSSSNTNVATINNSGIITIKGAGTATLTVSVV